MFPTNYSIDLSLYYCYNGSRETRISAQLECSENKYEIHFCTTAALSNKISIDSTHFFRQRVKKIFSVKEAKVGNINVKLNFNQAIISHIKKALNVSDNETNWTFSLSEFDLCVDEQSSGEIFKFYLSKSHNVIAQNMMLISSEDGKSNSHKPYNFIFKEIPITIGFDEDNSFSYIETHIFDNTLLSAIVKLISFYYGIEIQFWLTVSNVDNNRKYNYKTILIQQFDQIDMGPWLLYRIVGFSKFGISDFLKCASTELFGKSDSIRSSLFKALTTFTAIRNDSEINKFIRLVSILISIYENIHGTSWKDGVDCVKELFNLFGIDFSRIDDEDNKLEKQHFWDYLHRKHISNFVELRNEVMHSLPSDDIVKYLKESILLKRLEISVFIILMGELGFKRLEYIYHYPQLNVLKKE